MTHCLLLLIPFVIIMGCSDPSTPESTMSDLDLLPADTGGIQHAARRTPDEPGSAPYGHLIYLPAGMDESPVPYPLLVFLHGSGERGDSAVAPEMLLAVMRAGPPMHIAGHTWQPPYPMIVASPQCHTDWWRADDLRAFLEWLDARYPIDRSRIYLTGLSMGGYGVWGYLGQYGTAPGDSLPVAAAAPICGGGAPALAAGAVTTPLWAFHGTADAVVPVEQSVDLVKNLGARDPVVPPRLTLYDGVGHDSWSGTYDGSRIGEGLATYASDSAVNPWLAPYAPELMTWLLQHRR